MNPISVVIMNRIIIRTIIIIMATFIGHLEC